MENILSALVAQTDWTVLLLRIVLGVIFLAHGMPKLKNFMGTAAWLGSDGFKPGWFWAALLVAAEVGGGIFILLGIQTQIAALILVANMIVAIAFKLRKKVPFKTTTNTGWEFDLILIASLLLLATLGNGFFSVTSLF